MTGISPLAVSVNAKQFPLPGSKRWWCTARSHWMFRGKKWLIARFQLGKCLQFFVSYKIRSVLDAYWSMGIGKGPWLVDWGPPLWFWNSNIFWKLEKTPDIIDDYFNAIPWSFIFLSPLPWTSKKLAFTVLQDPSHLNSNLNDLALAADWAVSFNPWTYFRRTRL